MNDKLKPVYISILLFLSLIVYFVLYKYKMFDYIIVVGLLPIIFTFLLVNELRKLFMKDEKKYIYKINKILKLYNPILVRTSNLPNMKDKNILKVYSIEDLVNAQEELRKPIYYISSMDTTIFYLIDNDVVVSYSTKYGLEKTSLESAFELNCEDIEILA